MKIKIFNKKSYFLSIFVIILIISSNFFVSASILIYNNVSEKNQNNIEEWYDGSFQGFWGNNKDCNDGNITGQLNFGRSSSIGNFLGEWTNNDNSKYGPFKGRFRNSLIFGFIKNDEAGKTHPFIGNLKFNETSFKASIFGLGIGIIYICSDYEASFLPSLTGTYGVGAKEIHLIDKSRLEEFTPDDPDDFREMMIRIWYPIDKDIIEPRVDYMDPPTFAWLKGRSPVPLITIPNNAYLFVRPHIKDEPKISQDQDMYPVIIFSPGYDGVYQIYTSLIENIVSNGFIVVSINHPYISGITVFPDGRKIYVASGSSGDLGIRSVVEDAKFVLDNITDINSSDPDFQGKFDLSKVGMYGHSFGGASTSICCYEDERFLCGLTLDGVFYIDYISEGIEKPFMLMIAENRFNDDNVKDMWEKLNGDAYKVEILGSTHYAFTDVGVLLKHLVPLIPIRLLGFGTIEPKRCVNITRAFELVFFEVYLKNRPAEDIINLASMFDDVEIEFK